jgi:excisionase family DNA binding protein
MTTAHSTYEQIRRMEPISATENDAVALGHLKELLGRALEAGHPNALLLRADARAVELPERMTQLVARLVEVLAAGNAVTIVPVGKELTTQQAADLLNVSRQYLVRLLDEHKIEFHRVGKHRRVRIGDVLAYKAARDEERGRKMDDLIAATQDMGGYPELE